MANHGRPTAYTDEIADTILERMENGESLVKICQAPNMPSRRTICRWVNGDTKNGIPESFRRRYAEAQRLRFDYLTDDCHEIALRASTDPSAVAGAKLRIDTIKWHASKMVPSVYGDRTAIDVGGQDENPVKHEHKVDLSALSPEDVAAVQKAAAKALQGAAPKRERKSRQ